MGCEIGLYANRFFQEKMDVWGIDIDKKKIEQAKNNFKNINFKTSASETLNFKNNFFDIVFFNEVLEHVEDDKKTISYFGVIEKKK